MPQMIVAVSLGARAMEDLEEVGAAAVDFLFYSGYLTLAYCWGRIALTASRARQAGADPYLEGKVATARFYFARLLPRAEAHRVAVEAGASVLMSASEDSFGPW